MTLSIPYTINEWACFWFYFIGVNVIPANAILKQPKVEWKKDPRGNWVEESIPEEIFEEWIKQNMFEDGIAVICNKVFRGQYAGLYLNMIDLDNKKAIEDFGKLDQRARITIVEQHANPDKAHIYYYTDRPIKQKMSNVSTHKEQIDKNEIPSIEVKSQGLLSYCTPSPHKDGSNIEIKGVQYIEKVNAESLEIEIESICKRYGIAYLQTLNQKSNLPTVKEFIQSGQKIRPNENRSIGLLQFSDSLISRLYELNLPDEFFIKTGYWFCENYTTEMYEDRKINDTVKQAIEWTKQQKLNKNDEKYNDYVNNGPQGEKPDNIAIELTKLYILNDKIVDVSSLVKKIGSWCHKFNVSIEMDKIIDTVFKDKDIFVKIKQIAYEHGKNHHRIIFDKGQLIESVCWLLGRHEIKRIELTGDLIFFNDEYHETKAEALIRRHARDCLIKSSNADMNEIIAMIKDKAPIIKSIDIERAAHLKCLLNGTYNIKTGEFIHDFDSENIILNQIPHNFNENAKYDQIDSKVKEIIPDDKDKQIYYDFLSTSLHPYTGIDFQFGAIGPPGTGKSQLGKLGGLVLGEENISNAPIHAIAKDPTTQIDIAYKFLNWDEELSSDDIKHPELLKKWITQERQTARSIYSHNVDFRPTTRLGFGVNELYEIPDNDDAEAIYERTQLIKANTKFRNTDNEIKNIFVKVATVEQLEGFITYLLKNATRIFENEKIKKQISTEEVKKIWDQHGNRIREFKKIWLVMGVGYKTQKYDVWNLWLSEALKAKKPARGKNKFYEKFEEIVGLTAIKTRININTGENTEVYAYHGFRLRTEEEASEEKMKLDLF